MTTDSITRLDELTEAQALIAWRKLFGPMAGLYWDAVSEVWRVHHAEFSYLVVERLSDAVVLYVRMAVGTVQHQGRSA